MTTRVLGVDPGTAVTGYGVVEPANGRVGRLIECGIIRTNPREPLWRRLDALHHGLCEVITRHRPSVLAVETAFYSKNVRTAMTLGHARGVVLLAAGQANLDVAEFAPRVVKKSIVGEGGAVKAQVALMVQRLLHLKEPPTPADAADGVAVAVTYLLRAGGPKGSRAEGRERRE